MAYESMGCYRNNGFRSLYKTSCSSRSEDKMISFKKYTDIVGDIAKKLKVSKDKAVNALIKAQEKGINPLK